MTRIKLIFYTGIFLSLVACKRSKFDSEWLSLRHDGEKRTYLLHIPPEYTDAEEVPLVIALHGGLGNARNIEEQSNLPALSDEKGFILCSPNGLHRTWNAGGCCGKAVDNNVDDVGFIAALIDELTAQYSIDLRKIYITGMSNGAFMSYRLACELSDKIAAIAPVAGSMAVDDCNPTNPVSIIHFHSEVDANVPLEGGVGTGVSDHYNPPVDSVISHWAASNGCTTSEEISTSSLSILYHRGGVDSSEVVLYITADGGHSWPGGTAPRKKADPPSGTLDANALMWECFVKHPKP